MTTDHEEEGRRVDLAIRVEARWGHGSRGLEYTLDSPSEILPFHLHAVRGPELESSPEDFQRRLFHGLEQLRKRSPDGKRLSSSEIEAEVAAIGQKLFRDVFAGEMARVLRSLPEEVETLLITSNEPWIPWELLHDGETFLCLRFRMARWLAGQKRPAATRPVRRLLALRAEVEESNWDEIDSVHRLARSTDGLEGVFEQGVTYDGFLGHLRNSEFDFLHFSGHGEHDLEESLDPRILAADRPVRPHNVTAQVMSNLQRQRPFILLNSCQVGRVASALTGLQGWARTWIDSGCAGFLAPSWSVSSASARTFAESFYRGLASGLDLGRAVHAARIELRSRHPADLAWLAYVLYGMPGARISFGGPETEPVAAEGTRIDPSATVIQPDLPGVPNTDRGSDGGTEGGPWSGDPFGEGTDSTPIDDHVPPDGKRISGLGRRVRLTILAGLVLTLGALTVRWMAPPEESSFDAANDGVERLEPEVKDPKGAESGPETGDPAPPPPTPTAVANIATVPGRIAILPTRDLTSELTRAIQSVLSGVDHVEPLLVPGPHDPFSGSSVNRGAQFHLFVDGSVSPLDGPIPNVRTVSLTLDASLVDPTNGTRLARVSATHTGAGGTTDAALRQAAERCLSEILDTLRERTQP